MEHAQGHRALFDLFESSGIGLIAIDDAGRITSANRNVGSYLGVDAAALAGRDVRELEPRIRSAEFWRAFPGTFYCLAPGPDTLLLVVARSFEEGHGPGLRRALILRPYSLEREFGRMRVCLNNYLAHEIASHLNSVGIASEFITEPELRESRQTRAAFISTFRHDVADLNTLFVQLLETAEPLVLPNRASRAHLDWRALVEDLATKVRGLASERSVSLTCLLPPDLPSPEGDYHWLYLGLFGVAAHVLRAAPPLAEVSFSAQAEGGRLTTTIATVLQESAPPQTPWPPPALFPLAEANPRIGRLEISDLAVTRAIFLLHGGDLLLEDAPGRTAFTIVLPV